MDPHCPQSPDDSIFVMAETSRQLCKLHSRLLTREQRTYHFATDRVQVCNSCQLLNKAMNAMPDGISLSRMGLMFAPSRSARVSRRIHLFLIVIHHIAHYLRAMSTQPNFPSPTRPINETPLRYGVIVYPGYQALDTFGPLDALNSLSLYYPLQLSVISQTLDPVSTKPPGSLGNPAADFGQSIIPTHTFDTAPPIDVLIVPGGIGNRDQSNVEEAIKFIEKVYPTLRYLVTVCTGSGLAAQAGVLDGRRATTNKRAWARTTELRPQVKWVAHARWVVDGNIWSSSGVSAGLDVIFAFLGEVYGEEVATSIANFLEYERHTDATWDPYAELYGLA